MTVAPRVGFRSDPCAGAYESSMAGVAVVDIRSFPFGGKKTVNSA
jgi:hypothetical protein